MTDGMADDVCDCGDYASDHEGGTGACQAPGCACGGFEATDMTEDETDEDES